MRSVAEIVEAHADDKEALVAALYEREDEMKGKVHEFGMGFGMFPFIVAAVLMEVGLGTPISDDEAQMIRQNYTIGMTELQRQQREGGN